jgi:hypothetical protein
MQIYYLLELQQQINFKLLLRQLEQAKSIDFYLKDAPLNLGMGK